MADQVPEADLKRLTLRLPAPLFSRLVAAAEGLGVEPAVLGRMLVKEHLPEYERRAEDIRRREREAAGRPDE